MVELSREYGFKLIFSPEMVNNERSKYFTSHYSFMKDIAITNRDVGFLDLSLVLYKHDQSKVFVDNVHFDALGHKLVGQELFKYIDQYIKNK